MWSGWRRARCASGVFIFLVIHTLPCRLLCYYIIVQTIIALGTIARGGYSALNLPGCVSMKLMDMGLFWLQVSEVSGHVFTQNGSQIYPPTVFGGLLWTLSMRYGYFPIPFSDVCTQYHIGDRWPDLYQC